MLLDRACKSSGRRPQDPLSEDPLDVLAKWATRLSPDREDWFYRRSTLLHATNRWRVGGGNATTALRAMCIALGPKSEFATTDPGRGQTVNLHFGALGRRHVEEIRDLWPLVLNALRDLEDADAPWHDLLRLVSAWVYYPFDRLLGIPDEVRDEVKAFAKRIIQDLANISIHHPGLQHALKAAGERAGLDIDMTLDPEFEALHQHLDPNEEIEMMESGPPDGILATWERRPLEDMTRALARIESEANLADIHYPRWTPYLCARLAKGIPDTAVVAETFMDHELAVDLVGPFVLEAAKTNQPRWPALVLRCLESRNFRALGVNAAVTHAAPPGDVLSIALNAAADFPQHVDAWCLRGEVPSSTLLQRAASPPQVSARLPHW